MWSVDDSGVGDPTELVEEASFAVPTCPPNTELFLPDSGYCPLAF